MGAIRDLEEARDLAQKEQADANEDCRDEVLLAFRPENFLNYASFERAATSVDPGERMLLIDNMRSTLTRKRKRTVSPDDTEHLLLEQFKMSTSELLDLIRGNLRLQTAVRGGVAEFHLERALRANPSLTKVVRVTTDGTPDFEVTFRGRVYRIECKNVGRGLVRGLPKVDFQKTRAAKGDPCSRYYQRTQFEILAACIHPVTECWEFRFCPTKDLPLRGEVPRRSPKIRDCADRLSEHVLVGTSWEQDLPAALQRLADGA
jgi:hypothetical protein